MSKNDLWDISAGEMRELNRILAESLSAQEARKILAERSFDSWLQRMTFEFPNPSLTWDVHVRRKIDVVSDFCRKYTSGLRGFSFRDIQIPKVRPGGDEVLVLAVFLPDKDGVPGYLRTLDAWWDCIGTNGVFESKGKRYKKKRSEFLESTTDRICLLPGYEYEPGIRWLVVNTKAYYGKLCSEARELARREATTLTGPEILMLLAQCPEWPASWDEENSPCPNAIALQVRFGHIWINSVCLELETDYLISPLDVISLSSISNDFAKGHRSSPTVREC